MLNRRNPLLLALAVALAGCSHAGSVSRAATDYNRAMADARNEQLLINILRAGAREPLQFSALAEINASVNRTIGIDTVATNLITGGRDAISPTLKLAGSTVPSLKIQPLSSKEFTEGILRPITPETLHLFINQGWDTEFLLPLVINGYRCPGETEIKLNRGSTAAATRNKLATSASSFGLRKVNTPGEMVTMSVSNSRALEMLSAGVSGGYKVVSLKPGKRAGMTNVVLAGPDKATWTAELGSLCRSDEAKALFDSGGSEDGYVQLRSVEGIIYFLGEAVRPCIIDPSRPECAVYYVKSGEGGGEESHQLFRLFASGAGPSPAAITTSFHGRTYRVPRLDPGDVDRTLKTLSFLSQLVALQTAAVPLTPTVIALPQ
ncbi:MAG TPA: hypothetical protein VF718_01075 [Allosphingosinicella sp.]|jgi:hypothetical protein